MKKIFKFLKGAIRIHAGFAVLRTFTLNKIYPRKFNTDFFKLTKRLRKLKN